VDRHVVVVGAGLAGLAAARDLEAGGVEVSLIESGDEVGGRVRTRSCDGMTIDEGFQVLNPAYPALLRYLDLHELDLKIFPSGLITQARGKQLALRDPRAHPLAIGRWASAPLGGIIGKLRTAWLLADLGLRPNAADLAADIPARDWFEQRGVPAAMVEKVLQPFLTGVLLEDQLESSASFVALLLRSIARGRPGVPAAGMGALPKLIAQGLKQAPRLSTAVTSVKAKTVQLESGERLEADAVVVAAGLRSGLLEGSDPQLTRSVTTYWHRAPLGTGGDGTLVVDAAEGLLTNSVAISRSAKSYADGKSELVASSILGVHGEEMEARVAQRAAELQGLQARELALVSITAIADALPAMNPPRSLRDSVRLDGLYRCGDHVDTASTQGALASGRRAALAILADFNTLT